MAQLVRETVLASASRTDRAEQRNSSEAIVFERSRVHRGKRARLYWVIGIGF
jgi:hypothetical protein